MKEFKAAEESFALFDKVPVGGFLLRSDYTVLFWNRQIEEWTGISRDDINGKDISCRLPHLKEPKYADPLRDIFKRTSGRQRWTRDR